MRVSVYWNLHKKCFSIRAMCALHKGRVVAHASKVLINDATFVVNPKGRDRVRREGKKNVHAFVRGELFAYLGDTRLPYSLREGIHTAAWDFDPETHSHYAVTMRDHGERVRYGPYTQDHFQVLSQPVESADMVPLDSVMTGDKRLYPTMTALDPVALTVADAI